MNLREQQEQLVRALVAGGPPPAGTDADRVEVALRALLRKRASEVAWHWPVLLGDPAVRDRFVAWADGRPKESSFADGLAFARGEQDAGRLGPAARDELRRLEPRRRLGLRRR
ncbi:hypothetical protein [Jatrophihabitans fulvus]